MPTDWEPARAGHDRTLRAEEAGRGERSGSVRGSQRPNLSGGDATEADPSADDAWARKLRTATICRAYQQAGPCFFETGRYVGPKVNSWVITGTPVVTARRDYARLLPNRDSGGSRPVRRAARRWSGRPSWPGRGQTPVGASLPLRLSSCSVRPSPEGGTTNRHRPWPEQHPAGVLLITHGNMGSARLVGLFAPGEGSCRPATFRPGYASVCWRSCQPTLLAPKVCASNCCPFVK